MSKHIESTDVARADAIAQWGKVCEDSVKRYFAASRSLSEAALKSQCALLDAAGEILVAGNKVVASNLERLANGTDSSEDVRRNS